MTAKKRTVLFVTILIVLLLIFSIGFSLMPRLHRDNGNEQMEGIVRLFPGTEYAMLTPDYWIGRDRNADKLLISEAEISEINELNSKMLSNGADPATSIIELPETVPGEFVRAFLELAKVPENPGELYLNGKPTDAAYWEDLSKNLAIDEVPDAVRLRFGYSVSRATLKFFTTDDFIGTDPQDTYYDEVLCSELLPFLPLAVLHESADGQWYYVVAYGMGGWVRKEHVALCSSREDWLERQKEDSFLVVTGRELRLSTYPGAASASGQVIPMGTKLPLVPENEAPESFNGRLQYDCYIVKLPIRDKDGMINDIYISVPVNDDVNVGYLPYTRENIIKLVFKFLGDRYGWGGDYFSTDCSGLVHEVYSCFGFVLPRTASRQASIDGVNITDFTDMSDEQKLKVLSSAPMGSLIHFNGHIMIYLGTVDKAPYVISAIGGIVLPDAPQGEVVMVNSVVVNSLYVYRRNGNTWLNEVNALVTIG